MPINITYEDPVALGEAARHAYGQARRRSNLEQSIDNQLRADQANAQLALNYEQLYGGLAQREHDRRTGVDESAADRDFRARQQAAVQQHAVDQAAAAHGFDLERIEAGQAAAEGAQRREEDTRRKLALDRADGSIAQLQKEWTDGKWIGREAEYNDHLRGFRWEAQGLEAPPAPPPRRLTAEEEFNQNSVKLPGGQTLFRHPDGIFRPVPAAPDPREQIRKEFHDIRARMFDERLRLYQIEVEAWKNNRNAGPHPVRPAPPSDPEVWASVQANHRVIDDELKRRSGTADAPSSHPTHVTPDIDVAEPPEPTPEQVEQQRRLQRLSEIHEQFSDRPRPWPNEIEEEIQRLYHAPLTPPTPNLPPPPQPATQS